MKKILTVLLVMGFIAVSFTGVSFAQGPGMNSDGRNYNSKAQGTGAGYNLVEITDSQTEKIADFRDEFYNDTEDLRDELRSLNHEIRDLEFRGASNAEIGAVKDQYEDILFQLDEKRDVHQQEMREVLTEEQFNIIAEDNLNNDTRFQEHLGKESISRFGRDSYRGRFSSRTNRANSFGFCH